MPAMVYQMAYFLPEQYEAAWERGLLNATNYRDHGDYRRESEQTMRGLAKHSTHPIRIMRLDVAGLLAYAQREGKDPASRQTRLDFASWLHSTGRARPGLARTAYRTRRGHPPGVAAGGDPVEHHPGPGARDVPERDGLARPAHVRVRNRRTDHHRPTLGLRRAHRRR